MCAAPCRLPHAGVVLHFLFLRNMSVCAVVMTALAVPSLLFCTTGTRIPRALQGSVPTLD